MTDEAIQDILYLLGAWERGADAEEYVNEIEALRQALQRPVKSYTNNSPQYTTDDMYTKPQNVYTSAERVHESDKSIHDLRAAAEMALEALEAINEMSKPPMNIPLDAEIDDAMDALRTALAQGEPWDTSEMAHRAGGLSVEESPPEQEPVAWVRDLTSPQPHCVTSLKYLSIADTDAGVKYIPVYTAPPSKPWVGLTMRDYHEFLNLGTFESFKAIEAKLKELNHG